jgi:opacity protein-like surface antigen
VKRVRIPLLAGLFSLLVASAASAQGTSGLHFGVGGGISAPRGDAEDLFDTGWHGQILVTWNPPVIPVGLRVDGLYARMENAESTGNMGGADVIGGTANAVLGFRALLVKPYLLGGVGYYRLEFSNRSPHGSSEHRENEPGWNAGAGVSISLRKIDLFVEARYHSVDTEGDRFEFVPISVGLVF